MSTEYGNQPDIASFLIAERRLNEQFRRDEPRFVPGEEVEAVLGGLVHQMPNRVYCGKNGRLGRVLFYSDRKEGFKNAAYMQVMEPDTEPLGWRNVKKESLIANGPKAIEEEIMRWRRAHGMAIDLVKNPRNIYTVEGFPGNDNVYAHSVFEGAEKITCYYFITGLKIPYYVGTYRGEDSEKPEMILTKIDRPPVEILQHADFSG